MAEPLNPALALQKVMETARDLGTEAEKIIPAHATPLEIRLAQCALRLTEDVVRLSDALQLRDMEVAMLLQEEMEQLRKAQDDIPE